MKLNDTFTGMVTELVTGVTGKAEDICKTAPEASGTLVCELQDFELRMMNSSWMKRDQENFTDNSSEFSKSLKFQIVKR